MQLKLFVLYHGGEPLLNKNFVEMVKQIKQLGVTKIKTVSNGMLLNDDIIEGIVSNGLDQIEFSIDGLHPAENNNIRCGSDYSVIINNIKRLIQYKKKVNSIFPEIFIANTQFITTDIHTIHKTPLPPEYLINNFSGIYADDIAGFKCNWAMKWPGMFVSEKMYTVYHDSNDTGVCNECDQVKNVTTIRWDGSIVACCYDLINQYVIGNILNENLEIIWNNDNFLRLRQSIDHKKFIPLCVHCNVVQPNTYLSLKKNVFSSKKGLRN